MATETAEPATKENPAAEALEALTRVGFGPMASMSTTWVEAMSKMGSEVMSFVAERIKEDVKTQREILHCKDLKELQSIQARFLQRAIEQYTEETGKLVEMNSNLIEATKPPKSKS